MVLMRTRTRNGIVQHLRDDAYMEPPKVKLIKDNLVENFGYGKIDARRIAYEIIDNMEKYDRLEKLREDNLRKAREAYDNHTRVPIRPKTILEQRAEAKRGNVRI